MVNLVKRIAENPLSALKTSSHSAGVHSNAYETAILEATLTKITGLLQVGFGDAGAEIIGKNMHSGDLDPMLPGKKITAIFGFCDIRMFTDTTECLQEEVMVYVNRIGEIVHTATHDFYGAANKNIGDAFLLTWRICAGDLPGGEAGGDAVGVSDDSAVEPEGAAAGVVSVPVSGGRSISVEELCDSALAAFLRIQVDLDRSNESGSLSGYATHPAVLARFGPGFCIRMGFGMHMGWAIEGAVGSLYKIDATYLSPNVNMAARLEAATKQFRTPLLLSHWLVERLSPAARRMCRRIDVVTVKGSVAVWCP
jgi:class 3 adenylate cyclase